jgi:hypothetical protein
MLHPNKQIYQSQTSMNKIDEIEPEPDVVKD